MKIVIFGMGSIGKRHSRILLNDFDHEIYALRSGRGGEVSETRIKEIRDFGELAEIRPEIAFITNPTHLHVATALRCAALGLHLFIEKPLSHTLEGLDELEKICRERDLTCYVAYGMRFHPVIKELKKLVAGKTVRHARLVCSSFLPEWRGGRVNYSAYAEQGGGVLLDLSHEFDYLQYVLGPIESLSGEFGRAGKVTVDAEDYADVLLKLNGSIPVNLHLNVASNLNERYFKIDFEGGYLLGDLLNNQIAYSHDGQEEVLKFAVKRDDYLKEQTKYFLYNLGNPGIMNNLTESRGLLNKILEFKNGKR